jgi:hypothetical protein
MNGELAQAVALASHASAWLAQPDGLDAVAPWLLMLRNDGVERLWLATAKVSTTWTGAWTLGDRDAPDDRIWDVR